MRSALAVVTLGTLVVALPARAEKVDLESGVFGIDCTTATQLCEPPFTMQIGDPTRPIKVRKILYEASSAHCSAGRLLVDLDGTRIGKMRFVIGKERSTLRVRRRKKLAPGAHALAFRFEGRVGGCNTGAVSGWGGQITVTIKR